LNDLKSPRDRRSVEKRARIVESAMHHFAQDGYAGAKVEDIAVELSIAKGSIFQHFGSKAGLFFETYKRAVSSLPAWLDAPKEVLDQGFFSTVVYWLERTEHLIREDLVPYRVALIGNYGTDLSLKRDINRFLVSEDPYGTLEFVEYGIARGDVRTDIELEMIVSMLDWLAGSLQDALVTEELDPGLFHRWQQQPERQKARVEQFVDVLRSAIGSQAAQAAQA
jgi:TetR/AcrR family transcriptional regulator